MLPLIPIVEILGAAAAGLLLAGCAGSQKKQALPKKNSPPPQAEPKLGFTAQDHPLALQLLKAITQNHKLRSFHVFDRGYQVTNFGYLEPEGGSHCAEPKAPFCIQGRADGVLDSEEIWDFALGQGLKYRQEMEKVLDLPIPWLLDDFDPKTSFDEAFRKRIGEAIHELQRILKKQGLQEDTLKYQKQMALGLYYFTTLPPREETRGRETEVEEFLKELDPKPIREFKDFLLREGGLRILYDESDEFAALEALRKKTGACTEMSKILYGAMSLAGLKPIFVSVNPIKSPLQVMQERLQKNTAYGHLCVGLRVGKQIQLLDPSLIQADAPHGEFYLLSLRHYLSLDLLNHAQGALEQGEIKKHRNLLQKARDLNPGTPEILMVMASHELDRRNFQGAVALLSEAIKIYPRYSQAYALRGKIFLAWGKPQEALEDLNQALKIHDGISVVYWLRSIAWVSLNKRDQALEDLNRAVELNEEDPVFFMTRGRLHFTTEKYPEALADFEKALALETQDPDAPTLTVMSQIKLKKWEEVIASTTHYLEEQPSEISLYLQRGLAHWMRGDLKRAGQDAETVLGLAPESERGYFLRGWLRWNSGQRDLAIQDLAQSLDLSSRGSSYILFNLMEVFALQWDQAQEELRKAKVAEESDLDAAKAQATALLAALLWHRGEEREARDKFEVLFEVALDKKTPYSPVTQQFLRELFQFLPQPMQRDTEIRSLRRKLQAHR